MNQAGSGKLRLIFYKERSFSATRPTDLSKINKLSDFYLRKHRKM